MIILNSKSINKKTLQKKSRVNPYFSLCNICLLFVSKRLNYKLLMIMFVRLLWGSPLHSYSFRPAVDASGGLWDTSLVEVWSSVSMVHVLIIHGRFLQNNDDFYLLNVYAPCDNGAKHLLWNSLSVHLQ